MLEKKITLDNVSLIDFLGVQNQNINEIDTAFPNAKIIARGNELFLQGNSGDLMKLNALINDLLEHYEKAGTVDVETIRHFLKMEKSNAYVASDDDIILYGIKGTVIKPKSANQKELIESIKKNDLVFALGPAGTGKTYIAVALAVRALKNKEVKKIIITRPAVEAGENLGFLPGDLQEKIDPYLRPIFDALEEMIPSEKLKYYQENNIIEIAPLAYMRGRTLKNAFVLLDEAQNTTKMQMKMFLTRMGKNSKIIVNGDKTQVDLPRHQTSGFIHSLDILEDVKGVGFVKLKALDVVRHKLVKGIIKAYDDAESSSEKKK